MNITFRVSIVFLFASAIGFFLFARQEMGDTTKRYREATEEPLVDFSTVLANMIAAETARTPAIEPLQLATLSSALNSSRQLPAKAQIYQFEKSDIDIRVYVTDERGIVVFDSAGRDVGKDFSQWNDVAQTLQGRYGARSSTDPEHAQGSILYVASPIKIDGRLRGVVTVAKPNQNANRFIGAAKRTTFLVGILCFIAVAVLAISLSQIVTRPIRTLTDYVRKVRDGERISAPRFGSGEISNLAKAFEEMRDALEGRKYVEQYVQTLTHEIKSPLTAIRGAAELLREDPPESQRNIFLGNIQREVGRAQDLVEKLLSLSALQRTKTLEAPELLSIETILEEVKASNSVQLEKKSLRLELNLLDNLSVSGDRFWFTQALQNVLQNAIEFSPPGGTITLEGLREGQNILIKVKDQGPGIPEWALNKVFDSFYSLARPDTKKRSSGLVLTIVSEIISLHDGAVSIANRQGGGAEVTFTIPTNFTELS